MISLVGNFRAEGEAAVKRHEDRAYRCGIDAIKGFAYAAGSLAGAFLAPDMLLMAFGDAAAIVFSLLAFQMLRIRRRHLELAAKYRDGLSLLTAIEEVPRGA